MSSVIINPYSFATGGIDMITGLKFWHDLSSTGDQTDQSGNGNTATVYGSPSLSTGGGPGGRDAVIFDGVDDEFRVANSATVEFAGGIDFTWSCWIYRSAATGSIIGKRGDINEFWVHISSGYLYINSTVTNSPYDPTIIPLSTWVHYVVTYLASTKTMSIYRDGDATPVASAVYSNHPPNDTGLYNIGRSYPTVGDWFSGRLFGHAAWDHVLTSDAITELYNSGNGLSYADL